MTGVLGLCLTITVGCLLFILGYIVFRGVSALDWNFFTKLPEPVGESGGGLANAIVGSFLLVGLAAAFAVPLGILAAVYLVEYRSARLGPIVRFVAELLSGVPSIVIGILAYFVLVKPLGHFSGWAGAFALGVMMIPIVIRATEEALRLVPASLRHASYALGGNHWQTVLKVTLPAALPATITAVFLAVARVIGETAPLLLTAGSSSMQWPTSPNRWVAALPEFIFRYATSASEDWRRMGWAGACLARYRRASKPWGSSHYRPAQCRRAKLVEVAPKIAPTFENALLQQPSCGDHEFSGACSAPTASSLPSRLGHWAGC